MPERSSGFFLDRLATRPRFACIVIPGKAAIQTEGIETAVAGVTETEEVLRQYSDGGRNNQQNSMNELREGGSHYAY